MLYFHYPTFESSLCGEYIADNFPGQILKRPNEVIFKENEGKSFKVRFN